MFRKRRANKNIMPAIKIAKNNPVKIRGMINQTVAILAHVAETVDPRVDAIAASTTRAITPAPARMTGNRICQNTCRRWRRDDLVRVNSGVEFIG